MPRPADDFVRELAGAEDVLRSLNLIPVCSVATQISGADSLISIGYRATLRGALGLLLASGERVVRVDDDRGSVPGFVDLDMIKAASVDGWLPSPRGRVVNLD